MLFDEAGDPVAFAAIAIFLGLVALLAFIYTSRSERRSVGGA